MSVQQIDRILETYYRQSNQSYLDELGIGKFMYWCDENEYATEGIEDELDNDDDPSECALVYFDDDFPTLKTNENDKRHEIYFIIKYSFLKPLPFDSLQHFRYPKAFRHQASIDYTMKYWVENKTEATLGTIEQIAVGLNRYYMHSHRRNPHLDHDNHIKNKFITFCHDLGLNESDIKRKLNQPLAQFGLHEFDQGKDLGNDVKLIKDIMTYSLYFEDAFYSSADMPTDYQHWVDTGIKTEPHLETRQVDQADLLCTLEQFVDIFGFIGLKQQDVLDDINALYDKDFNLSHLKWKLWMEFETHQRIIKFITDQSFINKMNY